MADIGEQAIGMGANMALGRAGSALGVPLPDFQEIQMGRQGQMGRATRHFGGRVVGGRGGAIIGGLLGGPIGAVAGNFIGGWAGPHLASLFTGHGWNDNQNNDQPTGTVGGSPATTDASGNPTAGGVTIDPWSGQQINGGAAMPSFSDYGPYSGGYQAPNGTGPSSLSDPGATMPDFSQYGNPDQFMPQQGQGAPMSHAERQDYRDNMGNNGAGQSGNYGVSNFDVGGSPVIFGDNGMDPNGRVVYNWGLPGN